MTDQRQKHLLIAELSSVRLKHSGPPVVRSIGNFFVQDLAPDEKPCWVIPQKLAIGSQDCASDETFTKNVFTHIVNVGYDIPNYFENDHHRKIIYKRVQVADLEDFSFVPLFDEIHAFMDDCLANKNGVLLVHCQAGVSRSVTVVASYLMLLEARLGSSATVEDALEQIRKVRPCAKPNEGFMNQLKQWEIILKERFAWLNEEQIMLKPAPSNRASSYQVKLPIRVRLRRIFGVLRFLYYALRPIAFFSAVATSLWLFGRHKLTVRKNLMLSLALAISISFELSNDHVFLANFASRLSRARPGVFLQEKSEKMKRVIEKLPSVRNMYRAPRIFRVLGGDIATLAFVLAGYSPHKIIFHRELVIAPGINGDRREFSLDWAFPSKEKATPYVCLMLAGIGGDSQSPYIKHVAEKLVDDGFAVAVLLARGLGICSHTSALDRIYNPTDDEDVHCAAMKLSKMYRKVAIVGFSLGGVTTCRYFSAYPKEMIPHNVMGGVGVSGGFRVGFISLPRYENVYQEVLVPPIVDDILGKYGTQLETRLGGSVDSLISSTTYCDIHRELFTNAQIPNVETDFDKWKTQLESSAGTVHRPLLLLTALDDPLHHPEYLGINRLWDDNDQTDPAIHENLLVVVTDGGGHVSWPESGFTTKGYEYLQRIVSEFCHAIVQEPDI
jgi:predicted alpha/beta-fold hydrolase/protein-tyrosine phosphatase